ncbi:MAG: hypothetical protein U0Y68_25305 [Blastocatellia bacterium]
MMIQTTARIHLLAAKEAPVVAIIRRKPTHTFHIIRWNTETDEFEHGSWFQKKIYVADSDISFDGKWMCYMARGMKGTTWLGVCQLPYLKTYLEADVPTTYCGGGYWQDRHTLVIDDLLKASGTIPFRVEKSPLGNPQVLQHRLQRDGWVRNGENYGERRKVRGKPFEYPCVGDDGWHRQAGRRGTILDMFYRGHFQGSSKFEFRVREYPDLLDAEVEHATFTANGDLVFSRLGWVYRYQHSDISKGQPSFAADLNSLTREETQKLQ